ncbi:BTAD domain-containing putative transcriptional regulator [Kocuria sp. M1R5S2]|uniref:BTAD domain-containing putative transcriptional regulator n=1 Tax=Kocuria rhizosphaerae TaxID=3376285 RepID=UPI00378F3F7E
MRERLLRKLDRALSARLGLVVAAHGTGKTTLLAHWAARRPGPVIWHRVDAADSRPERLLARLARDVAALVGGPEPRSTAELAALAERARGPLCIVLDDVHLIVGTPAETELERLLVLSPPTVHLVVAGRQAPSFNVARPEFSTAVLVDGEDLRFRAHEAHALFRDVHGRRLDPSQVLDLVRTTDGWAAGLHLFHLHAVNRSPVERHRAACDAGAHYARDYLRQHVTGGLRAEETRLLQVASLFDVVVPRYCDALLGTPGTAGPALQDLRRRSFLAEDDLAGGLRMPALVRRFLAEDLRASSERGRCAALRGRAAALLERDGDPGGALALLAEDGRWAEALRLLERSGAAAVGPGACAWAEHLSPELVEAEPAFGLAEARRLFDDGRFAAAHAAASRALARTDVPAHRVLATELRNRAADWAVHEGAAPPGAGPGPERPLRAATRHDPASVARELGGHEEELLPAGIAWLLAGDRRAALPLLRRSARDLDRDRPSALAAQLVLALFGSEETGAVPGAAADEMAAVQRHARYGGLSWLARLSEGMLAALSGGDAGAEIADAVVLDCEERGDHWGAALLRAVTVLAGPRGGASPRDETAALAVRFRALHADVLAAWASSLAPRPGGDLPPGALALTGRAPTAPAQDGPGAASVCCFGGLTVRVGDASLDLDGVRPRARTVLRLLALHAGRPVHRDRLAGILWSDLEPVRALHNLQVNISALRHVLDEHGGGRGAIARQGDSYVLFPGAGARSDVDGFDALVHEAERARRSGDLPRTETALEAAVELYAGDLLPEEGAADWLVDIRDRYRFRAAQAAGDLARTRASLGRGDTAIPAAERSVELDPWRDESWRLLVELLQDAGELAEAERTRRRYHDMLDALGIRGGPG